MKRYGMIFLGWLGLALLLGAELPAQHLDGAWLAKSTYGAPGDPVVKEVLGQIDAYNNAKARAYRIQKGEQEGDLREAQQKCVDTALYSYVKAMYLVEMGRLANLAGNRAQALADYRLALKAAKLALIVDTHEDRTRDASRKFGATFKTIAERALRRLE